jgi:Putative prokaryotic signal transducing protein
MDIVLETNNPVELSFVCAVLADAGLEPVMLDAHMAALDGSIGAIPRRVCVASHHSARARALVEAIRRDVAPTGPARGPWG